jgi:alpha-glucosidase
MDQGHLVVAYGKLVLIDHSKKTPFITLYKGVESIDMYRGNFFIEDDLQEWLPLEDYALSEVLEEGRIYYKITFSKGESKLTCILHEKEGRIEISFSKLPDSFNRIELCLVAKDDEHIYGCGEQFSYFDLRGKQFPLWTGEQGVGRNKNTAITQIADKEDRAGGDYYTTFYPQPTFVSSRGYFLHAETYAYALFDFSRPHCHRLRFWDVPATLTLSAKQNLLEVVQDVSLLLGRQPTLPSWVYDGVILGIQGGTDTCLAKLDTMLEANVPVAGIWAQDWEGEKYTSFGKRLRWNWQWDSKLYPRLDAVISELMKRNIRFLGYINPYVLADGPLYNEAKKKGLLALNKEGGVYLVDFGEFDAAIVDFTDKKAALWYQNVIEKELIEFGLSGWMADFGEYLPTDVVLSDNSSALTAHNAWPGFWSEINKRAIEHSGKQDECFFFMRAGNARSLSSCPMMWAGDQNVDWSEDDGLPSVLTSALSLAMSGMGLQHSDIGGYTTLYGMKRTKELLLRWLEFSAFTPLMRTHEGNRPSDNWQFDSDAETIGLFARMASLHKDLKPYLQHGVKENSDKGIPLMRPLFLHYPCEPFFECKDSYLLGRDLFVAPVLQSGEGHRKVFLPDESWVHLFSSKRYGGGNHLIETPMGSPAVFYREDSPFAELFSFISSKYRT